MSTLPVSDLLSHLETALTASANLGDTAGPKTLLEVAALLRLCRHEVIQMEHRLAGRKIFAQGDNVVSLGPHLMKRYVIRRTVDEPSKE